RLVSLSSCESSDSLFTSFDEFEEAAPAPIPAPVPAEKTLLLSSFEKGLVSTSCSLPYCESFGWLESKVLVSSVLLLSIYNNIFLLFIIFLYLFYIYLLNFI